MTAYEKALLDELIEKYESGQLDRTDYEAQFRYFSALADIPEARQYLRIMDSFGWDEGQPAAPSGLRVTGLELCCGMLEGNVFLASEVDYLQARVLMEPAPRDGLHRIRSRILLADGTPFSGTFTDEIFCSAGHTWMTTSGWGNDLRTAYHEGAYIWEVTVDDGPTFSAGFTIAAAALGKQATRVRDVLLYAADRPEQFTTRFDHRTTEAVCLQAYFDDLAQDGYLRIHVSVTYAEDGSCFADFSRLHQLRRGCNYIWHSLYPAGGSWDLGKYAYSIRIGEGPSYEGSFCVY